MKVTLYKEHDVAFCLIVCVFHSFFFILCHIYKIVNTFSKLYQNQINSFQINLFNNLVSADSQL